MTPTIVGRDDPPMPAAYTRHRLRVPYPSAGVLCAEARAERPSPRTITSIRSRYRTALLQTIAEGLEVHGPQRSCSPCGHLSERTGRRRTSCPLARTARGAAHGRRGGRRRCHTREHRPLDQGLPDGDRSARPRVAPSRWDCSRKLSPIICAGSSGHDLGIGHHRRAPGDRLTGPGHTSAARDRSCPSPRPTPLPSPVGGLSPHSRRGQGRFRSSPFVFRSGEPARSTVAGSGTVRSRGAGGSRWATGPAR